MLGADNWRRYRPRPFWQAAAAGRPPSGRIVRVLQKVMEAGMRRMAALAAAVRMSTRGVAQGMTRFQQRSMFA